MWVSRCLSNFASDMMGFVNFARSALNSPEVMQPKRLFRLWNNSLSGIISRVCAGPAAPKSTSSRGIGCRSKSEDRASGRNAIEYTIEQGGNPL